MKIAKAKVLEILAEKRAAIVAGMRKKRVTNNKQNVIYAERQVRYAKANVRSAERSVRRAEAALKRTKAKKPPRPTVVHDPMLERIDAAIRVLTVVADDTVSVGTIPGLKFFLGLR